MTLHSWANIATVFLAIQCFVIMLVPLAAVFFMVRGINAVKRTVPGYLSQAQGVTRTVRNRTLQVSNQVAEPFLHVQRKEVRLEATVQSFSNEVRKTLYGDQKAVNSPANPQGVNHES